MKKLQIFGLLIVLAFSSAVFAQEKEKEKPKEAEKSKKTEKPKDDLSNFRTSNESSEFITQISVIPHIRRRQSSPISLKIPDIISVELSETTLFLKDTSEFYGDEENLCSPSKTLRIKIFTIASNPNNDPLGYNYTISGGKVFGVGARVIWDLSSVKPGTYTITAAVDDGCGFCGRTVTKTVTVKE